MEVQNKKNVVHDLLETGKSKGSLTTKEISDAFGDMDIEPEQFEKLYDILESQGIEIVDDMADLQIDDIILEEP